MAENSCKSENGVGAPSYYSFCFAVRLTIFSPIIPVGSAPAEPGPRLRGVSRAVPSRCPFTAAHAACGAAGGGREGLQVHTLPRSLEKPPHPGVASVTSVAFPLSLS